jgi:deoxyribonucleoside regulator
MVVETMASESREDLLVRVASLYYEEDYSQQQIANQLQISRSNISRMLKEAKQKGLVEIRIHKRIPTASDLEREFMTRFGLQKAMIYSDNESDYQGRLAAVGKLAAQYLFDLLQPQDVLAISWGTGVNAAVNAMPQQPSLNVDVVQMLGSVGTVNSVFDGPELARELAVKLGGQYHYLHAPLFVDTPAARDVFMQQPTISTTLNRARSARVALVGIGTTEAESSSFLRAGHLTEVQLAALRAEGVVGETCGQHFDIEGNGDNILLNRRVISLSLENVKRIPYVVAVACGYPKRKSILGALRGGYINALATDDITAEAILQVAAERVS